ncbi:MAG TPA: ankyrin repeat domain-containing protein [Vicinamibacterales bacterium]|jgi:hypothetical protein
MTAAKSLPSRPSLESLRKQAKKLARDRSVSLRDAQLVIAREYGYAGWQDLTAEVSKRIGKGLEWAVAQARRIIHDNDVEGLKHLLAEYPALLSWQDDDDHGGLLGFATGAYADAGDAEREQWFTRGASAELLIDAGAVVTPAVLNGLFESRARGLLELFHRRGLLPRTLSFFAAVGDVGAVRAALSENAHDVKAVNEAFVCASHFEREDVASMLLEHSIALDPEIGQHVDELTDRPAFIKCFAKTGRADVATLGLWKPFVMEQIWRALHDRDLTGFVGGLRRHSWLLGDDWVDFQHRLIGATTLANRWPDGKKLLTALFELDPAILRRKPPPPTQAIESAFTYASTDLLPLLTRVWPIPDDLPHAAGMGNLERVKRWFDAKGQPALGDVAEQAPGTSVHTREPQWGEVDVQQVLDTALAWAVINRHFDVADFLLEHGADINTNWNSHEPASILHHLVIVPNPYESMRFLIDRGIDMTIKDYRWKSNAAGWARGGYNDEKMAQWLEEAERQREQGAR